MSILDAINEAEERAAKIKTDARNESREMFKTMEENALNKRNNLLHQEQENQDQLTRDAEFKAQQAMAIALENAKKKNSMFEKKVNNRVPEAVSYVLERIVEQ